MYDEIFEKLKETRTARAEIYDGSILHVVVDDITLPNGAPSKREVVLHNGAVCIVPLTDKNEIIMERQFRYPFNEVIWEIPAGKIDKGEIDPLAAALRELKEETGYTCENIKFIGHYYPSPAILSEKIHMYVATGLKKGVQELDEDEFLDITPIHIDKLTDMILANEIPDGKTQAAVLKVQELIRRKLI